MAKIKFLGAAGTVTGSGFFLSGSQGLGILIDLGMFQGNTIISEHNYQPVELDITKIKAVILTHAHLDHCGRLPLLVKMGYKGPVYMTEPTRLLSELTLLDTAKIAKEDQEHDPIYTDNEVFTILTQMEILDYHTKLEVGEFEVNLIDAGHIMGSASVEVKQKGGKKIIFSGDLGNSPEDLLRPTEVPEKADVVVIESTYGDRTHANEDAQQILQEEINEIEKSGGTLLIPAFSIERAQEILHKIDHLKKENKVNANTPIFLDSPMAMKSTNIYRKFNKFYSSELIKHNQKDDPFEFPGLYYVEKHKDSMKLHENNDAKVIIAGSGMMTGGRIVHHAQALLPFSNTRLLIVGFQAEETLGRYLLEGAKQVRVNGKEIVVNAHIRKSSGMSAHADQPKLISWLSKIKGVKKVFLVHGENSPREVLAQKITSDLKIKDIVKPLLNEEHSF